MNNLIFTTLFLGWMIFVPAPAIAEVNVHIDIPLPPPIVFPAPPHVVVIPNTHVYVVPDIEEDIFFYGGWWWRPWQGRWYRSRYYDRDWVYYAHPPAFHRHIPPQWRHYYREHRWKENQWNYRLIPYNDLQHNWHHWKQNRYWERKRWGIQKDIPKHSQREIGPKPKPKPPR